MKWYAVMTRARMEDLAERNLRAQGYVTFYPHFLEWTTPTRARPREVKRPYLTRYIFSALNGKSWESIYGINNTIGVSRVVYLGPEALEIPLDIMTELMDRADQAGRIFVGKREEPPFPGVPGDKIKFSEASPLFGLISELEKVDRDGHIMVKIEKLLGTDRIIRIPRSHVGEIIKPDGSLRPLEPTTNDPPSCVER